MTYTVSSGTLNSSIPYRNRTHASHDDDDDDDDDYDITAGVSATSRR